MDHERGEIDRYAPKLRDPGRMEDGQKMSKPEQIAPMFRGAPANVIIPEEFKPWL